MLRINQETSKTRVSIVFFKTCHCIRSPMNNELSIMIYEYCINVLNDHVRRLSCKAYTW